MSGEKPDGLGMPAWTDDVTPELVHVLGAAYVPDRVPVAHRAALWAFIARPLSRASIADLGVDPLPVGGERVAAGLSVREAAKLVKVSHTTLGRDARSEVLVTAVFYCPGCETAAHLYETTGAATVCDCGRVYAADDFRWPTQATEEPAMASESGERPSAPAEALGHVLAELDALGRWEAEHAASWGTRPAVSPLARLQSLAACGDAESDATSGQVRRLTDLILSPRSKVGRAARQHFVDALVRYCDETSRPEREAVDPAAGAAVSARLRRFIDDPRTSMHAQVLLVLRRAATPRTTWDEASRLVADMLAPAALRAAWSARVTAVTPGRPRIDPTTPSPAVARLAWGEVRLRAAIDAWEVQSA